VAINPLASLVRTIGNALADRVIFPKGRRGEVVPSKGSGEFRVFRQVIIRNGGDSEESVILRVRFKLARMSTQLNRLFSLLPIPFFIGLPGFRAKLWTVNAETGENQGIYEWDSRDEAVTYASGFVMRFMSRRSLPGSVSHQILPVAEAGLSEPSSV